MASPASGLWLLFFFFYEPAIDFMLTEAMSPSSTSARTSVIDPSNKNQRDFKETPRLCVSRQQMLCFKNCG